MYKYKNKYLSLFFGLFLSFSISFYMNPNSNNRLLVPFIFVIPFTVFINYIGESLPIIIERLGVKEKVLLFMLSAVICGLFFLSFLSSKDYLLPANNIIKIFIYTGVFFIIYISIVLFYANMQYIEIKTQFLTLPKNKILFYALPSIIVWMFYLIAFYPGVMTPDSMNQWTQMVTGEFWDSNPVIHTLLNLFITRIWYSPAAIAITQILILSLIWGYSMYRFESMGYKKVVLYFITAVFALNPVNGIFSITLWKDILYSAFILLFTMNIINVLVDKHWIDNRKNFIFFLISAFGVMFFRHNGILPFMGTMILLICFYKRNSKPFIITVGSIIVIFFLIKIPLYSLMKVHPASSSEAFGIPTQQIAAVIKEKGYLTEEQKTMINGIMPLDLWAENYMPGNVDYIKFHKEFKTDKLMEDKVGFLKMWIDICRQNPWIALEAYGDQTSIAWSVKGYTNWGSRKIYANEFGLEQKNIAPPVNYIANKALNFTQKKGIDQFFWRPAMPMFLILLFGFAAILKNGLKATLAIVPVTLNMATVLIATPAQDYRYLYASTLVYLIIILFAFVKIPANTYKY